MRARAKKVLIAAASGVVAACVTALLAGAVVASKIVSPVAERKFDIRVFGTTMLGGKACVVLGRSPRTECPGTYSLWFEGGHAQLGSVVALAPDSVTRTVLRVDSGDLSMVSHAAWSGYAFLLPSTLGLTSEDVVIPTPHGEAPAWTIDGSDEQNPSTWAIHAHGLGSTRAGMLRGVRVAASQGLKSLVMSYSNDGEGPAIGRGKSTLGIREAEDVDAALEYAVRHGARRIILFGWSMGANIALKVSVESKHRHTVAGVVAVAPVLDWKSTIRSNCVRAGIPAYVGSVAAWLLGTRVGTQLTGGSNPVPFDELDWLHRASELGHPILILHGARDASSPLAMSQRLARARPDLVTLEQFESDHTLEWNSDPDRWEHLVVLWLRSLEPRLLPDSGDLPSTSHRSHV